MDTIAILKDGRTYVPLRFVVEALGYEVEYVGPRSATRFNHTIHIINEGVREETDVEDTTQTGGKRETHENDYGFL